MNRRIKENRVQCYLSHLEGLPLFYVVVAVVVLWKVGGYKTLGSGRCGPPQCPTANRLFC